MRPKPSVLGLQHDGTIFTPAVNVITKPYQWCPPAILYMRNLVSSDGPLKVIRLPIQEGASLTMLLGKFAYTMFNAGPGQSTFSGLCEAGIVMSS